MKPSIFKAVTFINIVALAILFAVWWINGREETWFYIAMALVVLSSFLYVKSQRDK